MPKIEYIPKNFGGDALAVIDRANEIISEYVAQGLQMTLRQLYYQFVARGYLPNRVEQYNRLGSIVSDGRMAGKIDWLAIVDRTRRVMANRHYHAPSDAVKAAQASYATDKWDNQDHYIEVWVEKEALAGVLEGVCASLDVPLFPCRGYGSATALWEAAQRLLDKLAFGKSVHILHLGDHDPSGMDMSRDILDRLELFTAHKVHVERVALNMDQVRQYNPPPDPAKVTDSRFASYQQLYGDHSWELDALEPEVLVSLVLDEVAKYRDDEKWAEAVHNERRGKRTLETLVTEFQIVIQFLRERRMAAKERV